MKDQIIALIELGEEVLRTGEQIESNFGIFDCPPDEEKFMRWRSRCNHFLQTIYPETYYAENFKKEIVNNKRETIQKGLGILKGFKDDFEQQHFSIREVEKKPIEYIYQICNRFDRVVRALGDTSSRSSVDVKIENEYDVQSVLKALLQIFFEDVRDEEQTPSYAGTSSRVDFLLKQEKIVIEVKMTRESLTTKELTKQLIIDKESYKSHQDCDLLVCFVYDPEHRISNPAALKELNQEGQRPIVEVIVRPE